MSGAQMVLECIKREGVETVFGLPGGAVLPIYDALYDFEGLRHILVRQEAAAGHAAEGYARTTGKVGVCMVTSGPAATKASTPAAAHALRRTRSRLLARSSLWVKARAATAGRRCFGTFRVPCLMP